MSTCQVYVDTSSLYFTVNKKFKDARVDYVKYLEKIKNTFGEITRKVAYVPVINEDVRAFIKYLEDLGFEVKQKPPRKKKVFGKTYYATNWNVELCLDVANAFATMDVPEYIVVGSSDPELEPLFAYFRDAAENCISVYACSIPHGIRDAAWNAIEIEPEDLVSVEAKAA